MPTLKWVRRPKSGASGAAAAAGGESARRAAAAVPDPVVSAAAEAVPDSAVSASSAVPDSMQSALPEPSSKRRADSDEVDDATRRHDYDGHNAALNNSRDASWPISGGCASGTTTTPAGAGGALSSCASGATGTSLGVSPGIVGENWTTRLMVPTGGGDANLSLFLGGAAANHTDEDFPPGCIFYKTTKGRGSPKRLYVSKEYTDSKVSIDALKKVVRASAKSSNVVLNAERQNEKKKHENKTYQRIYFSCRHKKNCNCKMHFTLNYDPEMRRWYLISESGHPEHIPHERGQPPRKSAKRKLTQVALEQQGLASSDFGGDAATQRIVTAAAVALCKNAKRSRV